VTRSVLFTVAPATKRQRIPGRGGGAMMVRHIRHCEARPAQGVGHHEATMNQLKVRHSTRRRDVAEADDRVLVGWRGAGSHVILRVGTRRRTLQGRTSEWSRGDGVWKWPPGGHWSEPTSTSGAGWRRKTEQPQPLVDAPAIGSAPSTAAGRWIRGGCVVPFSPSCAVCAWWSYASGR